MIYISSVKTLEFFHPLLVWLRNHKLVSQLLGCAMLILSALLMAWQMGTTSGVLVFIFAVVLFFSLLIVLFPIKKVFLRALLFLGIMIVFFELVF